MGFKEFTNRTRRRASLILLFLFLIEINLVFSNALARVENIAGFQTSDTVNPNEFVSYRFPNNLIFEINTTSRIELSIEYETKMNNRQSFFSINTNETVSLHITSKTQMKSYGFSQAPNSPKKGNFKLRYQYNCIFKIRANSTIKNLTVMYRKINQFGLSSKINYTLAKYDLSQDSWELVETEEKLNQSVSELYLVSSLSEIESDTDYYITLFEFTTEKFDWTWVIFTIVIVGASLLSVAFLISKKDYFQYLRQRTVSIEKGAHRLSLDEVLENENRNKIIDLILNEPGIHFNELLRKTGLAAGNLVWHLDILQTFKIIGKKRIGNFIAYFPYYQKNPISNIDLKLQKSKLTLEILEIIEKEPGIWNNLITKKFKVDHKTIHYHLNKLQNLGLIKLKKDGRKKKIFPNLESEYYKFKNGNDD
ncbi:MAG: winged helix-turn-helix transcriptional regulator [Promethearchaeota archaeon]